MAALTGLMAASEGINAISSISSAYAESQALRMQGDFDKNQADANAKFAGIAGEDAIARGETSVRLNADRVKGVIGSQRTAAAAQGVDVNSGSAAEGQKSTAAVGALDAMTIRNNAIREALGYKVQALNYTAKGEFASMASRSASRNTLLTGGMNAIGYGLKAGYWGTRDSGPAEYTGMGSLKYRGG